MDLTPAGDGYAIAARVGTVGRTGVEMEALVAVSAAALTLYDMLKAVDRGDGHRARSGCGRSAAAAAASIAGAADGRRTP